MSDEQQRQITEPAREVRGSWGVVFCWTGIYLLRLLAGLVAGAILMVVFAAIGLSSSLDHEFEWWVGLVLVALVLILSSIAFLPLWKGREKISIRGQVETIRATRLLLLPALVFQLFATFRGGVGVCSASLVLVVGVCFLVTLALDVDRRSQFVLLLIAGAQAIILCLVALMLGPLTPTDGWQIKAAVWLGAVPPIVLMGILLKQSRQVLMGASSAGSARAGEEPNQ